MGYVTLIGPDGSSQAFARFGPGITKSKNPDISNNGIQTDAEIADGRQRLESQINRRRCGYGGLAGNGGWFGGEEVCVQPWRMGGPARENTPDGYSMKVTLRFVEEYQVPLFINNFKVPLIQDLKTTPPKDVEMTARWEKGKVHFYQGEPPLYNPPAPPRGVDWSKLWASMQSGTETLFAGAQAYLASAIEGWK